MTYIDGFIAAVPEANKQAYIDHAKETVAMFKEFGAIRLVENWGDDVPDGKVTDFRKAVQAEPGEVGDALRRQAHDLRRLPVCARGVDQAR